MNELYTLVGGMLTKSSISVEDAAYYADKRCKKCYGRGKESYRIQRRNVDLVCPCVYKFLEKQP